MCCPWSKEFASTKSSGNCIELKFQKRPEHFFIASDAEPSAKINYRHLLGQIVSCIGWHHSSSWIHYPLAFPSEPRDSLPLVENERNAILPNGQCLQPKSRLSQCKVISGSLKQRLNNDAFFFGLLTLKVLSSPKVPQKYPSYAIEQWPQTLAPRWNQRYTR